MNIREFEQRAEAVFGPKWRKELPRHYGKTDRAVRYWLEGEVSIPREVCIDLLNWTKPGPAGRMSFLVSKVERAFETIITDPQEASEALEVLSNWMERQTHEAKRYDRAREIRLRDHEDHIMRLQFERETVEDARLADWFNKQHCGPEWEPGPGSMRG